MSSFDPKEYNMISALLLASAIALPRTHAPVQTVAPVSVRQVAPARSDAVKLDLFAYCDASQQPTIMLTNVGSADVLVTWTVTAVTPGHASDVWSNVSFIEAGQFEGWMAPVATLNLVAQYDDDGQPTTRTAQAACSAGAGFGSGLDE
jgi:hypothetical protein